MSPEIEKQFFERWPSFFSHKDDRQQSLMQFGFDCADGWRTLLSDLFTDIERSIALENAPSPTSEFKIVQVKEKFGTLQVYTANATPAIDTLIEAATSRSQQVCELCGRPGMLFVSGGRWATRCAGCAGEEGITRPFDLSGAPQVGVFWLVRKRLIMEGTPLEEAAPWKQDCNDPRSHLARLEQYRSLRIAPIRTDWADYPRGRVIYETARERFQIYADLCILGKPELIAQIKTSLNLPPDTQAGSDDHYRCAVCKRGGANQEAQ